MITWWILNFILFILRQWGVRFSMFAIVVWGNTITSPAKWNRIYFLKIPTAIFIKDMPARASYTSHTWVRADRTVRSYVCFTFIIWLMHIKFDTFTHSHLLPRFSVENHSISFAVSIFVWLSLSLWLFCLAFVRQMSEHSPFYLYIHFWIGVVRAPSKNCCLHTFYVHTIVSVAWWMQVYVV